MQIVLCDEWFKADLCFNEHFNHALWHHLLRFYVDQCYSPVAGQFEDLHRRVLPLWWFERAADAAGHACERVPDAGFSRHWWYALDPGTMSFHYHRLASVFWCTQAICVLSRRAEVSTRVHRKAFRIIRAHAQKR